MEGRMGQLQIGAVQAHIPLADSPDFDVDTYRETGFFVVRDVVPKATISQWQKDWSEFYKVRLSEHRSVDPYNPVQVNENLPSQLADIHACPQLLDVMQVLYPDLALFTQRFVIKDQNSRDAVFPHGDFCYDYGWPEKTTVFIPLSESNQENGGISFYPGTHHFGYLGDAGAVNTDILESDWPLVCPSLNPGDIALCHTCTWHCSPPHVSGPDRILVQATFQPSSDPSSIALLRGKWRARYRLNEIPRSQFFVRSRSTRLRELQSQVDREAVVNSNGDSDER